MENVKSRTPEKPIYLKAKSVYFPCLSLKVTLRNRISNTVDIPKTNTSQHVNGTTDTTSSGKSPVFDVDTTEKFADQLNTLKEVKEMMEGRANDP